MMRKDDVNIRSMFFVKFVFSFLSLLEGRGKYYRGLSLSPLIPLSQLSREKERERENEESWKKSERKKRKEIVENRYGEIKSSVAGRRNAW